MPSHYRRQEVLDHLEALSPPAFGGLVAEEPIVAGVPPLTPGEDPGLGHGALYHPWPATEATGDARRLLSPATFQPPDGAVLGVTASLTNNRGAWLAPANRSFSGVIALEPRLDAAARQALTAAHVNVIVQEPRGCSPLNADTLGRNSGTRLINVRRLSILLRRLALREGTGYVFEPNDAQSRNLVRHRFERLLADLYVRAALAGPRPQAAYRVIIDESVNTPQSLDLGRFIVELRVAPSRPLAFLTVRLVQT
ncbi:MAG: hypothetical protein ACREDG_09540, partial [Methylocella sp.]